MLSLSQLFLEATCLVSAYRKTSGKALVNDPRDKPPCLFDAREGEGHQIVFAGCLITARLIPVQIMLPRSSTFCGRSLANTAYQQATIQLVKACDRCAITMVEQQTGERVGKEPSERSPVSAVSNTLSSLVAMYSPVQSAAQSRLAIRSKSARELTSLRHPYDGCFLVPSKKTLVMAKPSSHPATYRLAAHLPKWIAPPMK